MELEAAGLLGLLLILLMALLVVPRLVHSMRRSTEKIAPVLPPPQTGSAAYDWDRRTHQVYRKYKGINDVNEPRAQILACLDSHEGVEAMLNHAR